MSEFTVYTKNDCPYCVQAKKLLKQMGYQYSEIDLNDQAERTAFYQKYGFNNENETINRDQARMPKIWHGTQLVGGYDDLAKYLEDIE